MAMIPGGGMIAPDGVTGVVPFSIPTQKEYSLYSQV